MESPQPIIAVQDIMANHPAHQRAPHSDEFLAGAGFVNGRQVPLDQATIGLTDTGFAHADATYDVTTASRGFIFRLDDHLQRFAESCDKFRLSSPYSLPQIKEILIELVESSGLRDCFIWWCVTRGGFPPGLQKIDPSKYQPKFFAYVSNYRFYAEDDVRSRGLDVVINRQRIRIPSNAVDPTAKNFHWMDMKMAMFDAFDEGYDWCVLLDQDGFLTEAPGSNICLIQDDTLITPENGCLLGITRRTALELADSIGLRTEIRRVTPEEALSADEAFFTSSAGGIAPINSIDRTILSGNNGPGPVTTKLHNLYWEKRWSGWHGHSVAYATKH